MTKDELEILLSDKSPDAKMRGAVLYNAVSVTMSAYNQERTVSNLRNMDAAKEAFDKFVADLGGGAADNMFDNLATVLKYLQDNGWKAARNSLYRHQREGKILPDATGKYTLRAVEKYAKTFLKQSATGKRVQENTDDLQRRKLEKEIARLELGLERDQFALDKDRGLYIPCDQMEIELATRAGVLVAGLKHWVQSKAADWITAVGGDTKRTGELINIMTIDVDEHINHYAGSREYEVEIAADENSEASQP